MRRILILLVIVAGVLGTTSFVLAQAGRYGIDTTVEATDSLLPTSIGGARSVPEVIGRAVAIVLSLLGIVFFLIIFYAGLRWMIARGNSERVEEAKGMIEAAIIGLLIVLASYAISNFIFQNLLAADTGAGSQQACQSFAAEKSCTDGGCVWFPDTTNPLGGVCGSAR